MGMARPRPAGAAAPRASRTRRPRSRLRARASLRSQAPRAPQDDTTRPPGLHARSAAVRCGVPFVRIATPLLPGAPIEQHYREAGQGEPLLVLHGGWGYAFYPFDAQIAELGGELRFLMPDR